MNKPILSAHFESRKPSAVRLAQMKYEEREVKPEAVINVGIGNVSLPANPAMQKRMFELNAPDSPFANGVIRYTTTAGTEECQNAFKNILNCEGFDTSKLKIQVTDGGSAAMELLLIGACGPAGTDESPLLMIDPAYTNYISFAQRTGRKTVTVKRHLGEDGNFTLPEIDKIEEVIKLNKPGALLVIPYDNPTGQLYDYEAMIELAKLCVKYNMWMVSDEAYRELYYESEKPLVSIWGVTDAEVPGISVRARMKRVGYSLSKAFKNSFEFVVSIFSVPTIYVKVRKPHIRDSKLAEVEKELQELCEPCDIFLHKTAYQANDWMIPGYFSHSGIWLGRESEQEALGLFDKGRNHFSYHIAKKNEEHLRAHPVFEGLFGGIMSTSLQTYMLPCDTIAVLRFKEGYGHDKSDIACKAVSHLGQKYDFGFDVNNIDTIVCSELIYQCYPSSIKWPVTKALGRYTFSPDEIGSMGRADGDFPFEVIYFHDGERSYKGSAAQDAYKRVVEPKLKFGEPQL